LADIGADAEDIAERDVEDENVEWFAERDEAEEVEEVAKRDIEA
jgi:hypothetical protein